MPCDCARLTCQTWWYIDRQWGGSLQSGNHSRSGARGHDGSPRQETIEIAQLQAYLRHAAQMQYEAVHIPPFTAFFHSDDVLTFFNYAIPDEPIGGDLCKPLERLRAAFRGRERLPRFEFIEGYAPELAPALRANGFEEESRLHLMMCVPETYRPAAGVAGLSIMALTVSSSPADIQAFLMTRHQGFEPGSVEPVTEIEAERFRSGLASGSGAFLALLDGRPVGAASYSPPFDRLTEVAGIATLEPYRRRGIGTALTAAAVATAFDRGVEAAILSAADARAGRVYEAVGFRATATMLAYRDPLPESAGCRPRP